MPEPTFVPSPAIARAVAYAAEQHGAQTRKGTQVPYLHHLFGVAAIAMEFGATETDTIAAILHDVLEDTAVSEDELRERFGAEVAEIVEWCSAEARSDDDPVESWKARKQVYLDHLAESSSAAVLVSLADKIHNARSLAADQRRLGDEVWDRFNARRVDQIWYYTSLLDLYERRLGDTDARISDAMVAELRVAVGAIIDFRD